MSSSYKPDVIIFMTDEETIESMLPAKTKFMGVNFVIESHALERHKLKYYYNEIYLIHLLILFF